MDFDNADDFDSLVERSKRIDEVLSLMNNDDVAECVEQMTDWGVAAAESFVAQGFDPQATVTALVGTMAGVLARWLCVTEEDDGEEGN